MDGLKAGAKWDPTRSDTEKPISLLSEMVDLWVPPYGTVMDLYAGTFTLPIACVQTSRRCIAIEKDSSCYNAAIQRLEKVCLSAFKYVHNPNAESTVKHIDGGIIPDNENTSSKEIMNHQILLPSLNEKSTTEQFDQPPVIQEETSRDFNEVTCENDSTVANQTLPVMKQQLPYHSKDCLKPNRKIDKRNASENISNSTAEESNISTTLQIAEPASKRIRLSAPSNDFVEAGEALIELTKTTPYGCS